jgi:anti-sigma regulatory factor (Ser/Thr protein kinase)
MAAADHDQRDSLTLDPLGIAAGDSRRFVRQRLESMNCAEVADNAALAVTELVTNAAIHAKTPVTVTVSVTDTGTARVAVRDYSPLLPRPRRYGVDATTGRGLRLVEAVSHRWGVEAVSPDAGGGKIVWFEPAAEGAERVFAGDDWLAEH